MAVDVVEAGLGIVFHDEDAGLRPEFAVGDSLDDLAEGEIVVGDLGARGGIAAGVIVGEMDEEEVGPVAGALGVAGVPGGRRGRGGRRGC